MKKIIAMIMLVIVMVSSSITALAGDIPESLLHDENAQLFFGEVLSYHPNKEKPSMSVSPVVAIKGNVKEGTMQNYDNPNPMGSFRVQEGKVYLFAYYENVDYIDIFEVSTYDTRTLRLKHVEGSMWERFEEYINEGKYGEAKVEGMLPYKVDFFRGMIGVFVFVGIVGAAVLRKNRTAMTKVFMCSLCHNGILGGGLYLDPQSVTYKTGKLTIDKKYKNLVLPLKEIEDITWKWLIFPIATFHMENGEEYRIIIFNKVRFRKYYQKYHNHKAFPTEN